jgi:hypothetical protein
MTQLKKSFLCFAASYLFITCSIAQKSNATTNSQGVLTNATTKTTADIKVQVDSIKLAMAKDNFTVVREANMNMESEYELPVVVPLNENTWYHVVFIGDNRSKLIEIRMYDWEEKQIIYKKSKVDFIPDGNGDNSNIINYQYIPKFSEYHMIKPVQVSSKKKQKELKGYILLFKKVLTTPAEKPTN